MLRDVKGLYEDMNLLCSSSGSLTGVEGFDPGPCMLLCIPSVMACVVACVVGMIVVVSHRVCGI